MRKAMLVLAAMAALSPLAGAMPADAQIIMACEVNGVITGTSSLSEPVFGFAALSWEADFVGVEQCGGSGASMRNVTAHLSASGVVHRVVLQGQTHWDGELDITVTDPGYATDFFEHVGVTGNGTDWVTAGATVRLFGSHQIAASYSPGPGGAHTGPVAYH